MYRNLSKKCAQGFRNKLSHDFFYWFHQELLQNFIQEFFRAFLYAFSRKFLGIFSRGLQGIQLRNFIEILSVHFYRNPFRKLSIHIRRNIYRDSSSCCSKYTARYLDMHPRISPGIPTDFLFSRNSSKKIFYDIILDTSSNISLLWLLRIFPLGSFRYFPKML